MAKRFFYVSAALFLLALTYHLGVQSSGAAVAMPQPSEVAVLSGSLNNGAEIPLPVYADGTTAQEGECQWIVSARRLEDNSGFYECYTNGRTVIVRNIGGNVWPGSANYLIVAVRGAPFATAATTSSWGKVKVDYRK